VQALSRVISRVELKTGEWVLRFGRWGHWLIASLFCLVIVADYWGQFSLNKVSGALYDTLVSIRLDKPAPSPDVVILDIDEGSLAALSPRLGRWPWPNHAFAELLEALEDVGPKAVVFDIIFSDRDSLRPESDLLFDRAIERASTRYPIFFPMVRLSPENDAKSEIPTRALPGARHSTEDDPAQTHGTSAETMAILLPQLPAALDYGTLGFLNVHTDPDGVLRRYPVNLRHGDYEFDSYATAIARHFESPVPDRVDFLINWHGPAFTLPYISVSILAKPSETKLFKATNLTELKGKIVIIGSTAPALQDFKATPMGNPYPGLEALATAIDNLLRGETISPSDKGFAATVAVLFVLGMATLFFRFVRPDNINIFFLIAQFSGLALAWLVLSFFNIYLNFSAAVAYGTAFFFAGKLFNAQILPTSRVALRQRLTGQPGDFQWLALRTTTLSGPEIKTWHETVISTMQKQGVDLLPVIEGAEQLGAFAEDFQQTHVFVTKSNGIGLPSALEHCLDRIAPKAKVIASAQGFLKWPKSQTDPNFPIAKAVGPIALAQAITALENLTTQPLNGTFKRP
jgi:CHASE2 domain-containing sensor protein